MARNRKPIGDLALDFAGLKLRNPLVLLSGTAGYGQELAEIIDLKNFGGLVCKTVTAAARTGNPPPRTAETPSGLLNSIGLENPGLDEFIRKCLPSARKLPLAVIVSIAGDKTDLPIMAEKLAAAGAAALEINLSCPNVCGAFNPTSGAAVNRLLKKVRPAARIPVLAKLPPDLFRIQDLVKAAEDSGVDGLTVANTFPAMAFDLKRQRPLLGGVTGGLSGPAILPLALYLVFKARQVTRLPILGSGGVHDADSAAAMLLAGADAVGLGTVNFYRPDACRDILPALRQAAGKNPGPKK